MEKRYRKRKYKQWLARLPIERHYNRVIEMCTKYLERKLSTTNSIHTLIFAHSHGMDRLYRLTASFIDVHFESVFTSDEFFELSIDDMITLMPLLIYDEMNESDMQNALLLWYKYKRIERKQRGVVMRPNYQRWLQERNKQRQEQHQDQPVAKAIKSEPNDGPTEAAETTKATDSDEGIPEAPPPPRISD